MRVQTAEKQCSYPSFKSSKLFSPSYLLKGYLFLNFAWLKKTELNNYFDISHFTVSLKKKITPVYTQPILVEFRG